jgi:acetolactate synthase-1/2/3 large subunit
MAARRSDNPVVQPEHRDEKHGVNVYYFVEQLQKHLADDAIVTTDVGIAYIATNQALRLNGRQRLFHSGGVSAMGCGLPSAIGAQKAGKNRQTICLAGDGGMMLNLQELQTVDSNQIPLVIFVFANNGYYTIQVAQENHFKRHSIASPVTGLSCPDFVQVAKAFGIPAYEMFDNDEVEHWMEFMLTRKHPVLCVVHVSPNQKIEPRVTSRLVEGKFVPVALYETGSAE